MIILGGSYYNGPKSIFTGTAIIKDVNKIVLQNGIYDRLYVSEDISKQEIVDTYTSEAAKSVKIESGINRIETIDVYGKTTQEGTGDASPNNVSEIENAGICNKRITIDQNNKTLFLFGEGSIVGSSRRAGVQIYDISGIITGNTLGNVFCQSLPRYTGNYLHYNDVYGISIENYDDSHRISFRIPGCMTLDDYKARLKDDPLDVIYQSTEDTGEFYTGIEITQGDEYRCEIIDLKDRLHEGDKVETNVQSEYDTEIEITGNEFWSERSPGSFTYSAPISKETVDFEEASNSYIDGGEVYSAMPDRSLILFSNAVAIKDSRYSTVGAFTAMLKERFSAGNPVRVFCKSTSGGTGKNVRRETHVKGTYIVTGKEHAVTYDSWVKGAIVIDVLTDAVKVEGLGTVANIKCSHLKVDTPDNIARLGVVGCGQGNNTKLILYLGSTYNTTELTQQYCQQQYAAGTPITIEYELATPEVFADEPVIVENKAGEYTVSFESTGRVKLKPVINQEGWSDDTIIDAGFNGDLAGGNVDFTAGSIDKIRIKRRKKGTANWVDLKDIIINVPDDFTFTFYDLFAANAAEYTYAVVPVIGDIEGNLSTVDIQSMFNGFFIADKNTIYGTEYNVNVGAATKNEKSSVVQTLGAKYPFIIDNGYNNYYTVPISLFFYNPNLDWPQNVQYRQTIVEWLHNGTAKIFKSEDGRIWLAKVTTAPVLTPGSNLNITSIDFSITEIGESNSTEDLYNSGLLSLIKES